MKNIGFLIYSLNCGGSERIVSSLSNFLSNRNFRIFIFLINTEDIFYSIDERVSIIQLRSTSFLSIFSKISEHKIDSIFGFTRGLNFRLSLIKIFFSGKVILCERTDPSKIKLSLSKKIFRNIFYKFTDLVVVQNYVQYNFYKNNLRLKRIVKIPNFTLDSFFEDNNKLIPTNLLSVGRLVDSKNQIDILKAFLQINHPIDLKIIGDGPNLSILKNFVINNNLSEKIFFLGKLSNVKPELNKGSIFISTSKYEGFPNSLIEAMASKMACIHYYYEGLEEIIDNGVNGIIVYSVEELAFNINLLLDNPKYRIDLGINAHEFAKKYKLDNIGNMWVDIIAN